MNVSRPAWFLLLTALVYADKAKKEILIFCGFPRSFFTTLLGRILLCQIASREFSSATTTEPLGSKSLMDTIASSFLRRSSLSLITYKRAIHKACIGAPVQEEHLEALGAALGHKKNSAGMALLRHVSGSGSVEDALFRWCESVSSREAALEPFLQLGALCASEREEQKIRLARGTPSLGDLVEESVRAVAPYRGTPYDTLVAASAPFIGITKDEILPVFKRAQVELVESDTCREAPTALMEKQLPWRKEPELYTLPLDQRWDAIARRLMNDLSVSISDLHDLLTRFSPVIADLEKYLGRDTPWFVAAASFYKEPDYALSELLANVRRGKESKYKPQDFLRTHATWVESRGTLGKLTSTSMALNFREPFIAPGPKVKE